MKNLAKLLATLLLLVAALSAQSYPPSNTSVAYQLLYSTVCSSTGCASNSPLAQAISTSIGIGWYTLSWTTQGSVLSCSASVDSNDSLIDSWTIGGIIPSSSVNCASPGSYTTPASNYVNLARLTPSITGTGNVTFTLLGFFNKPSSGGGSLPSGTQGFPVVNNNGALGYQTSALFYDTSQVPGTDRCGAAHTAYTASSLLNIPINMVGEVANASATQIKCNSNPFPVTGSYGGSDAEGGGSFQLPEAALYTSVGLQLAANNVNAGGVVEGSLLSTTAHGSNIIANSSSFSFGSGTTCALGTCGFSPFVVALGSTVGNASSTSTSTGPYNTHFFNEGIDAQAIAGLGGISTCSLQDNSGLSHINIRNARTVGLEGSCGTTGAHASDDELIEHFFITHNLAGSVESNTTPANISAWSCAAHVCTITWNNSPTAVPGYGHLVQLAGLAVGGTHGLNINNPDSYSGYEVCAVAAGGWCATGLTADQFAIVIQSNVTDSSSTVQGTAKFYTTGARIGGNIMARQMFDGSISSNTTDYASGIKPLCQYDLSGNGITVTASHAEVAENGFCLGLNASTSGVTLTNITPSSDLVNGVYISGQWGTPTNLKITAYCNLNTVTNCIYDVPNSCVLTQANNGVVEYDLDLVGAVWTNANPADIVGTSCTAWDFYNGQWQHYTAGALDENMTPPNITVTGSIKSSATSNALVLSGNPSSNTALAEIGGGTAPTLTNNTLFDFNGASGYSGYLITGRVNGGTQVLSIDANGNIIGLTAALSTAANSSSVPVSISQGATSSTFPTAALSITQGSNTGSTNVPAVNIATTWNNSSITGPVLSIAVTNTSSATGAVEAEGFGGSGGTTAEWAMDASGNFLSNGIYGAVGNTSNTTVAGGVGLLDSGNNTAGGLTAKGGDASNTGSSTKGGYAILRGGMLTAGTPNGSALEGVSEVGAGYLKGTAIAALGDVVCGTTTAFTVTDCPHSTVANNIIGIATSTSNPIGVVSYGLALVKLDGALTAIGDNVCMSTTTDGQGHDNGSTTTACTLGEAIGVIVADSGTITTMSGNSTAATAMSTTLVLVQLHISQ